jgi:hypothetical protein
MSPTARAISERATSLEGGFYKAFIGPTEKMVQDFKNDGAVIMTTLNIILPNLKRNPVSM